MSSRYLGPIRLRNNFANKMKAVFMKEIPPIERVNVLHFYRQITRALPHILRAYEYEAEDSEEIAQRNIRKKFEKYRHLPVRHPSLSFIMQKGWEEFRESVKIYKTKSHVEAILFPFENTKDQLERNTKNFDPIIHTVKDNKFIQDFLKGNI